MPVETREEEVAAMRDPGCWPQWPLLPIKKGNLNDHDFKVGCLISGRGPVIYLVNLWSDNLKDLIETCEKETFESFEAMYDAGWRSD